MQRIEFAGQDQFPSCLTELRPTGARRDASTNGK
jgi:hypothetical protein